MLCLRNKKINFSYTLFTKCLYNNKLPLLVRGVRNSSTQIHSELPTVCRFQLIIGGWLDRLVRQGNKSNLTFIFNSCILIFFSEIQ